MTLRTSPYRRALVFVSVAAVIVAGASAAFATTDPEHSIDITADDTVDPIDVPAATYTAEGESVEVNRVGRTGQEGTLTYAVDAPAGEYYTIRIVDSDGTAVETEAGTGDDTFEIYPRTYDVGTYVIAVTNESDDQREVYAAEPFIVRGYTITQDTSSTVESDGTLRVDVSLTSEGSPPAFTSVTVAVGDDSTMVEQNATRINDTAYYAEFDVDQFKPGKYRVVSGVRGEMGFDGSAREYYGISDSTTVTITESTATPSSDSTTAPPATTTTQPAQTTTPDSITTDSQSTTTAAPSDADASTTTGASARTQSNGTPGATEPRQSTTTTEREQGADGTPATPTDTGSTETTGAVFHPLGVGLWLVVSALGLRRMGR